MYPLLPKIPGKSFNESNWLKKRPVDKWMDECVN